MTFIPDESDELTSEHGLTRTERGFMVAMLGLVAVLTILDVYEDWIDGATLGHIIPEVLCIIFISGVAVLLLRRFAVSRRDIIKQSRAAIEAAKRDSIVWQEQAKSLKHGVSDAIMKQLAAWGLTQAEQDIAFLILKGLSLKEISEVRQTSERTIRQQASEIYRKSGLTGRAQLSAFFLEDLFA